MLRCCLSILLCGMTGAIGLSSFLLAFGEFLIILCRLDQQSKVLSVFEHCQVLVFLLPILVSLDSQQRYQFSSKILDIYDQVW